MLHLMMTTGLTTGVEQDDNWVEQNLAAVYHILVQHAFIVCCSIACATCKLNAVYTLQHATNVCVCMHLAPLIHAHAIKQLSIINMKCATMCACICMFINVS